MDLQISKIGYQRDEDVENLDYNGVPLSETIKATSLLTGGSSNSFNR